VISFALPFAFVGSFDDGLAQDLRHAKPKPFGDGVLETPRAWGCDASESPSIGSRPTSICEGIVSEASASLQSA